ncbi:MAG: hypothetical protein MJH10_20940, partial [Epibacterium sp.]|nr:hypothetical protein [Epibacterium sp.]
SVALGESIAHYSSPIRSMVRLLMGAKNWFWIRTIMVAKALGFSWVLMQRELARFARFRGGTDQVPSN